MNKAPNNCFPSEVPKKSKRLVVRADQKIPSESSHYGSWAQIHHWPGEGTVSVYSPFRWKLLETKKTYRAESWVLYGFFSYKGRNTPAFVHFRYNYKTMLKKLLNFSGLLNPSVSSRFTFSGTSKQQEPSKKNHYSIANMMDRKIEDLLFSTATDVHPEQINGLLATRANLVRAQVSEVTFKDLDAVVALANELRAKGWNVWETTREGIRSYPIFITCFDEELQIFPGWFSASRVKDDHGYMSLSYGGVEDHSDFLILQEKMKAIQATPNYFKIKECNLNAQRQLTMREHVYEAGKVELGLDVFYPFMQESLDDYFKAYMASKAPLLILKGPPGTGKSTWLRTLIARHCKLAYLTYEGNCATSTEFLNAYYEDDDSNVAIIEDLDNHLGPRAQGNDWMSVLLNRTEGLVKRDNKKLIITTNLKDDNEMEDALRRTGRCYDILDFSHLSEDQAEAVNLALGRPSSVKMFGASAIALSDVLNPLQRDKTAVRTRAPMGFVRA